MFAGFFGAQVSPSAEFIVAYNYTGSLFGWSCGSLSEKEAVEYANLNWKPIMMSSGHFYSPVSMDWVKVTDSNDKRNSTMVLMTAGKDKVVRAYSQIVHGPLSFWQVRFSLCTNNRTI